MASTINKRPERRRAREKMTKLIIRQEEQDSEFNCSKSDQNLEGDNKIILVDTPKFGDNSTSACKEKFNQYTSTNRIQSVELETFCDDLIEFKNYIDDILNSLNFDKEFDVQDLSDTNNDAFYKTP